MGVFGSLACLILTPLVAVAWLGCRALGKKFALVDALWEFVTAWWHGEDQPSFWPRS